MLDDLCRLRPQALLGQRNGAQQLMLCGKWHEALGKPVQIP